MSRFPMRPIISVGVFPRKGMVESKIINVVQLCEHSAQGFPGALRIPVEAYAELHINDSAGLFSPQKKPFLKWERKVGEKVPLLGAVVSRVLSIGCCLLQEEQVARRGRGGGIMGGGPVRLSWLVFITDPLPPSREAPSA